MWHWPLNSVEIDLENHCSNHLLLTWPFVWFFYVNCLCEIETCGQNRVTISQFNRLYRLKGCVRVKIIFSWLTPGRKWATGEQWKPGAKRRHMASSITHTGSPPPYASYQTCSAPPDSYGLLLRFCVWHTAPNTRQRPEHCCCNLLIFAVWGDLTS